MLMEILNETSRTLGEYLLLPNLTTDGCVPEKVDLSTPLLRHRVGGPSSIRLAIPIVSAVMQAVSSPPLAIALAQCGGISFIHHNQPIAGQVAMVNSVKRHKAGFRYSELNVKPTATLGELAERLRDADRDVVIVTDDGSPHGHFMGIISTSDFHPQRHALEDFVETRMRHARDLVTAPQSVTLSEANTLIWEKRLDVLPIVSASGSLESVVLRKDYELHKRFRYETVDMDKRFRVGAGINTHDYEQRVPELIEAGADVLCIDSSDGYSVWQQKTLEFVKRHFPNVPVGAGNVVDGRAFRYLAEAGADFVKIGIGGGSICITRDQKGIGRGQASAIADVARERDAYSQETGEYVPLCSDGGILNDYHMAIALALGADFVMLGRYFARFDESPSSLVRINGQLFKEYWGEGSNRARNVSRYEQGHDNQLVFEEGVDGYVPYAGSLYDSVALTMAKIKSTMVSCGSTTLPAFYEHARLVPISAQSYMQNSHEVAVRDRPQSSDS